jgi:hypothetical protein
VFGVMTVARHEREMAKDAADYEATLRRSAENHVRAVDAAGKMAAVVIADRDGWRSLATKLAADLADLQRRYAPMPIPDDLAPGEGSVGDGDAEWTPTALAAKAKAVR